ncbi:RNA-directed DNA polymerase, eukaryota, reverse transcriptase zinc-binding domain protein, partial [Tanacetum coccineum]
MSKNNNSNVENQIVECNENRENGESNMECDANVDSMIVDDNCNEDAEVGYRMSVNELRYNLRRMWSRYGFKDIVDCNNGIFFMKFHHEEVPLLIKLCNVPLEALTVKGISALASRVGKPLVMDSMTASMCKQGIGMVRYARVLIKVSAKKELAENVKIVYKNEDGKNESNSTTSTENKKESVNVQKGNSEVQKPKETNDSFVEVKNRKNIGIDNKVKEKSPVKTLVKNDEKMISSDSKEKDGSLENSKKKWFVHKDILEAMKRSANKFTLFEMELLVDKGRKDTAEVECNEEDEDVLEDLNGVAMSMEGNEGRMEEGCRMFKTVKSLKDKDPHNHDLRSAEAYLLKMYTEAMKDEEKVADQFVRHFQKFLGESRRVEQINDMESLFQCKLSNDEAEYIIREVNDEEIRKAMFQIDDNKAPGPDGKILKEINSTIIALVPKIQTPLKVSDFRPIACCNVLYKCISKIITQRIKGCLDKLMGPKRVAVKADIQKAYGTVNLQILEDILNGFGFHSKMSGGYFKGGRGFRQGDTMSSYLFTLVMEILTLIIKRKVEQNNNFQYHFGCKKLKITNVCFADDLLMFCHADKSSVSVLKDSIEDLG